MITLSEGIYLEDRNAAIPWGVVHSEAIRIGNPESRLTPTRNSMGLYWTNVTIFGGLPCQVEGYFKDEYSQLTWARVVNWEKNRAYSEWCKMLEDYCTKQFGAREGRGWKSGTAGVKMWVDERFGESAWLTITNNADFDIV